MAQDLSLRKGLALSLLALCSFCGLAAVLQGFGFTGLPQSKLVLTRETDSIPLGLVGLVKKDRLEAGLTAVDRSGRPLAKVIYYDSGLLRLKVATDTGPFTIHVRDGLADVLGRPYIGPGVINVSWAAPDVQHAALAVSPHGRGFFGVNSNASPNQFGQVADWARTLGVGFVRLGWSGVASNPDCLPASQYRQWQWTELDKRLDAFSRAGAKVLLVPLQFNTPACASGSQDQSFIFSRPDGFADFVAGLLAHVLDRNPDLMAGVEIGNEPDVDHFWKAVPPAAKWSATDASAYFSYLQAASSAARKVALDRHRQVTIVSGGFGDSDPRWWRSFVAQPGLKDSVDALATHLYPWAGPPPAMQPPQHNSFQDLASQISIADTMGLSSVPIWITELGIQTLPDCPWSVGEATQARLLRASFSYIGREFGPRVARVAVFPMQDDSRARKDGKLTCYSSTGMGLVDEQGRKRPSFMAYQALIAGR